MKTIKYTVEITGVSEKQEQVKIVTYASSAQELLKDLEKILDKKSKFNILKVIGLSK